MFCEYCHKELNTEVSFCPYCGKAVIQNSSSATPCTAETLSRNEKLAVWIGVLFPYCFIPTAIVIHIIYTKLKKTNPKKAQALNRLSWTAYGVGILATILFFSVRGGCSPISQEGSNGSSTSGVQQQTNTYDYVDDSNRYQYNGSRQNNNKDAEKLAIMEVLSSIRQIHIILVGVFQAAQNNDFASIQRISYQIQDLEVADLSKCPDDFQKVARKYIEYFQTFLKETTSLIGSLEKIKNSYADQNTKTMSALLVFTDWAVKLKSLDNGENTYQALLNCAERHGVNVSSFR